MLEIEPLCVAYPVDPWHSFQTSRNQPLRRRHNPCRLCLCRSKRSGYAFAPTPLVIIRNRTRLDLSISETCKDVSVACA